MCRRRVLKLPQIRLAQYLYVPQTIYSDWCSFVESSTVAKNGLQQLCLCIVFTLTSIVMNDTIQDIVESLDFVPTLLT